MNTKIQAWAGERGYRVAWCGPDVLDRVREDIQNRRAAGEFDDFFWKERLSPYFKNDPPGDIRTVIVVAAPQPGYTLDFQHERGTITTFIPPTFAYNVDIWREARSRISKLLGDEHRVDGLPVPVKATAARTGLVQYGRINVTFIPEFGSYYQLMGFVTDAEIPEPVPIVEPRVADSCEKCRACLRACPTGAIVEDRFLIRAERCICFWSEFGNDVPWPEWMPNSAHHCLVGCMRCQEVCPQNRGKLRIERLSAEFAREETALLLAGPEDEQDPAWKAVCDKFSSVGLYQFETITRRNLRSLLESGNSYVPRT